MAYVSEHIVKKLKEARLNKGLSQRALSKRAGVPQSHISKIESGAVDLRISSLIELARALDLELTLVPRKAIPAVQSIIRTSAVRTLPTSSAAKELSRIQNTLASISEVTEATSEVGQLQRRIKDLQRFQLDNAAIQSIRNAAKTLEALKSSTQAMDAIRNVNSNFEQLRNALAHASTSVPKIELTRSAYSLDEEDDNA